MGSAWRSAQGPWRGLWRVLILTLVCAAVGVVGVVGFACVPAHAFVLPSDPTVGAGSQWTYDSNLGKTLVRMLERENVGPGVQRYSWDMRVAGLTYEEGLELTADRLSVTARELQGFGIVKETFDFSVPELVLALPLKVGKEWSWTGMVQFEGEERPAEVTGKVVGKETITVPAGTFETYRIQLLRTDDFGTHQVIDLWFNPDVGPIRAVGDLKWRGLIGFVQELVGLKHFKVELVDYTIARPPDAPVHQADAEPVSSAL